MASSVNLAATSATLSAPLVITINCTTTIMTNIMNPTKGFPLTTKFPKDSMTFPTYPSVKISLVDDTLSESLSIVAINKREGNMEKSRGFSIFIEIKRITREKVTLKTNNISIKAAGSGIIIITIIAIAIIAIVISPSSIL